MAEMDLLIDDEALDLVEHRRMGLITIRSERAAWRSDADRRLAFQHRAVLHRRGVGAQQLERAVGFRLEVERVVLLSRLMLGRNVGRGEIIEVVLDLWSFGDQEAEIGPDLYHFFPHLAHRMD